ncbi:MAG TPA: class I SAM-dependent methyltransferase [Anaerolineales bacterium]|nr:class I SAM-dependent methyltransferase [Anaerolineales bacterium]
MPGKILGPTNLQDVFLNTVQNLFRRLFFQYMYFRQPPWDTGISPPELIEFIQIHQPGRAIDIGCGTGTNVIVLAKAGWQVTGVDFAPRAIKLAKQKIVREGIQAELSVSDATTLHGITGPFDLALDLGCFHGISKEGRGKYLDQLERLLVPNGFWLLYAFLSPGTPRSGHGLAEAEIDLISARFTLRSRRDGFDKGERSSAWFLFQKN